jgi:antiviral helicase SLH1
MENKRMEHPKVSPKDLIEATSASSAVLERAARFAGTSSSSLSSISRLPVIKLGLGAVNALSLTLDMTRMNAAKMQQNGIRIFAPRYPKPQTEGFFVILSYSSTDEIIALKRVGWNDTSRGGGARGGRGGVGKGKESAGPAKLQSSTKMSLPEEAQGKKVDIHVLSDSYPGMKWGIEGINVPEAPRVDVYNKGKEKEMLKE